MPTSRYSLVAIILHWCIAAGILAMLVSGFVIYQEWLNDAELFKWFQWHKSLGVVLIALISIRICWRIFHSPPKLESLSTQQLRASNLGHIALYALLIIMPLSGWLAVSSSELQVPTLVFNVFKWPHLPLPESMLEISRVIASNLHFYGSIAFTVLIVGHITMVFKHRQQGLNLLERMPVTRMSMSTLFIASVLILLLSMGYTKSPSPKSSVLSSSAQTGEIQFNGIHAEKSFNGVFKQWTLNTNFDPTNQSLSTFELIIDANSISTGNTFYDETLSEEDWFDPENYPKITFIASDINKINATEIKLSGTLTIKDLQTPLEFTATLTDNNRLDTSFILSRLQLGLGKNADPEAEWVDENIQLTAWSQLN